LRAAVVVVSSIVLPAGPVLAEPYAFQSRVANPSPVLSDNFGKAIAYLGTYLAVGTPDADPLRSGEAHIIDPATGTVLHTLLPPGPAEYANFGAAIAAADGLVVVGAPSGNPHYSHDPGAAYLYDGTTGAYLRAFANPTPSEGDEFGASVAIGGGKVLIGAPGDDFQDEDSGTAYLFDAATGALLLTLHNPVPADDDYFGGSVAMRGTDLLVGQAAYVANGNVAAFGTDVVIGVSDGVNAHAALFDGTTGALLQSFATPAGPAAYVFDATTGALLRTLTSPYVGDGEFGRAVATVGSRIVVGAFGESAVDPLQNLGAAYVFDGTTGALEQTILKPAPTNGDAFGWFVATTSTQLAIVALIDTSHDQLGGIYLYDVCGDGVLAAAEQCDDGNLADGDGCSSACRLELCPPSPRIDCRVSIGARKSKLQIQGEGDDTKDGTLGDGNRLKFTWGKGAATTAADFADPLATASYALCLYDASGAAQPLAGLVVRPGAGWQANGVKGYRFRRGDVYPDGVSEVRLGAGGDGKAKIAYSAAGSTFRMPAAPLVPPVTVQAVNGDVQHPREERARQGLGQERLIERAMPALGDVESGAR
jgi:cysteine-rich repeat protein